MRLPSGDQRPASASKSHSRPVPSTFITYIPGVAFGAPLPTEQQSCLLSGDQLGSIPGPTSLALPPSDGTTQICPNCGSGWPASLKMSHLSNAIHFPSGDCCGDVMTTLSSQGTTNFRSPLA